MRGGAIVHGFDTAAIDAYFAHYATANMFTARALEVGEGAIESDRDVMPRDAFVRTEFYNDFLVRHLDARSLLTTLLIRDREQLVMMTLCRGGANAPFGEDDKRVLSALAPHLKRAHQIAERLHIQEARTAQLEDLLDRAPRGVAIVSASGRVRYANRPAENLLARGDALAVGANGLRAASAAVSDRLRALIAEAAAGTGGGALALPSRTGAGMVQALVTPFGAGQFLSAADEPCALLLLRSTERRFHLLPEHARAIFGLSASEAQVATLLHSGLDLTAIAAALAISRNTARVHLNAILAKTGARRQATLMQRLSAVAELYGAPAHTL